MKKLVIVTGSGRSGTSSVSGTLKRFGFHIPQPEVETDERNPRGYYEPLWVAQFHKKWLNAIPVRTIDTRPTAGDIAMATVTPEREATLRTWLQEVFDGRPDGDVVIVKETRAYWVYPLWERVAADVGVETTSLTMLRHPTQVVRSRDSAYLSNQSDELRLQRETTNVAAWMNSVFETERATRNNPRAFVRYYDLIGDWRAAMTRAGAQLGVDIGDLTAPHDVDDFITTSLNRSSDSWEGLTLPDWLRDMAEETWAAAGILVETPDDAGAMATLDRLRADYIALYAASAAISADEVVAAVQAKAREMRRAQAEGEQAAPAEPADVVDASPITAETPTAPRRLPPAAVTVARRRVPADVDSRVLMVTGAGRSGTSTVAGSLKLLGLHLPQPEVPADETNPRGFFESQWVVDFHKSLLTRTPIVRTIDARPEAQAYAAQHGERPEDRAILDDWLYDQVEHPQVLVKDPRAFWLHDLWRDAAAGQGASIAFLTMLRHPTEVAQSRDAAYVSDRDDDFRRRRTAANVAAWVNATLVTEEVTRDDPRAFVRYDDLLTDWRGALAPAVSALGITVNTDLASRDHHPVDDFIDSGLRTRQTSWDNTEVPDELRRIADGVWAEMDRLADDPANPAVAPALAALRADYARLHENAVGIALDHTNVREAQVRRTVRREADARVADLERRLKIAEDNGVVGLARRVVRRARR